MSRTDYHIQNDPELGFLQAQRKFIQSRGSETALASNPLTTVDLIKDEELKEDFTYDTAEKVDIEEVKEEKMEAVSPKQDVKTEEKNQKDEKIETENGAEVKSKENHSIPQVITEEKVTESEDTPTLPVPVGRDTNKEEQENLTGTENHKPNTEKNSEEEEEDEKMDEDDKSEKSSQAEGKHCRSLTASDISNLFIQVYSINSHLIILCLSSGLKV